MADPTKKYTGNTAMPGYFKARKLSTTFTQVYANQI